MHYLYLRYLYLRLWTVVAYLYLRFTAFRLV